MRLLPFFSCIYLQAISILQLVNRSQYYSKTGKMPPKKTLGDLILHIVFGDKWFRSTSIVFGVIGLIVGIFRVIFFFEDNFKSGSKALVVISIFLLVVIGLLVFLAFWYELHIRLQVEKAKEAIEKNAQSNIKKTNEISSTISLAAHNFIHKYRSHYFELEHKNGKDYNIFFKELYTDVKPVMEKLVGDNRGFDCAIKLINKEKKLISIFRNRDERQVKSPESIEQNYFFEYFKGSEAYDQKFLILNNIKNDLKDNKTPASQELKKRSIDKYNSLFAIPLFANIPDVHIKMNKSFAITEPKPMIGFIGFDSMAEDTML